MTNFYYPTIAFYNYFVDAYANFTLDANVLEASRIQHSFDVENNGLLNDYRYYRASLEYQIKIATSDIETMSYTVIS